MQKYFRCNEKPRTDSSKFCIFHDEKYVEDYYPEYEHEAAERFEEKVRKSSSENISLECIGYFIPYVEFVKLTEKAFSQPVYFNNATFYGANFRRAQISNEAYFDGAEFSNKADFTGAKFNEADFTGAKFSELYFIQATFSNKADFSRATFSNKAYFYEDTFSSNKDETRFNYITFEQPNKVIFGKCDLSKVSFADSDITRIRFGEEISWRGKDGKDEFTIIEEEWLKEQAEGEQKGENKQVSLEDVLSVYRNLRENYEFRLRYDDAGKFFIKEMELKRKYRELKLKGDNSPIPNIKYVYIQNGWLRRNFSLNGLYYHFSRYGESIWRPTAIGVITVGLSTLLWLTQSNPTLEPSFLAFNQSSSNISNFTGTANFTNPYHLLKSFERSFADFLPLLPIGSEIKVGIIDYIIKIVGGALTFGLLAIDLRRKFERKYTR
jgi:hypothetical protein